MVELDHQLLITARDLLDGPDVQGLKELIFDYEQAVDLHNRSDSIYRQESEWRLREWLMHRRLAELRLQGDTAIKRADEASLKSSQLLLSFGRIERRLSKWNRGR